MRESLKHLLIRAVRLISSNTTSVFTDGIVVFGDARKRVPRATKYQKSAGRFLGIPEIFDFHDIENQQGDFRNLKTPSASQGGEHATSQRLAVGASF